MIGTVVKLGFGLWLGLGFMIDLGVGLLRIRLFWAWALGLCGIQLHVNFLFDFENKFRDGNGLGSERDGPITTPPLFFFFYFSIFEICFIESICFLFFNNIKLIYFSKKIKY